MKLENAYNNSDLYRITSRHSLFGIPQVHNTGPAGLMGMVPVEKPIFRRKLLVFAVPVFGLSIVILIFLYCRSLWIADRQRQLFLGYADDQELEDPSVDPCTDFYSHICGNFAKQTLPADHDEWFFAFDGVKERIALKMHATLQSDQSDIGVLFRSCTGQASNKRNFYKPHSSHVTEDTVSFPSLFFILTVS